jgi:hypothetical protein
VSAGGGLRVNQSSERRSLTARAPGGCAFLAQSGASPHRRSRSPGGRPNGRTAHDKKCTAPPAASCYYGRQGNRRAAVASLLPHQRLHPSAELPIQRSLRLTAENRRHRTIIMRPMCDRRLEFAWPSKAIGCDFASRCARALDSLANLEADGSSNATRARCASPRGACRCCAWRCVSTKPCRRPPPPIPAPSKRPYAGTRRRCR